MLFLAQTNATTQILSQILLFGGFILIIYFMMVAPQRRKQSEIKRFRDTLKEGMMIVTFSGLHGKIHNMTETTITLMVDKHTKLIFDREAVSPEATTRLQQRLEKEQAPD